MVEANTLVFSILIVILVEFYIPVFEPFFDCFAEIEFYSNPTTILLFAYRESSTTSPERIEDGISRIRADFDYPFQKFRRECICFASFRFEFLMAHDRNIGPNISKIQTFFVHEFFLSSIVLYIAATMSAGIDWYEYLPERFRLSLGEI